MEARNEPAFDPSGGDVLNFALRERAAGRGAAIVTLAAIDGAAPRALGAQMAVAEDGRFAGSISSGCLERAIQDEARRAIARGEGGVVRYGKDSPFLDVVLPCGSGVDLLYTVDPAAETLAGAVETLAARRAFALGFRPGGAEPGDAERPGWANGVFTRVYPPGLRIVAAGLGAELVLFSRVASAAGYEVCAISPDAESLERCRASEKIRLRSASEAPKTQIDPWTAYILLFHDREWELTLAPGALASSAFYIGAVGSPRTHAARLDALRARGLDEAMLARIRGPIGLIPKTRDPATLAVSVLAGVLDAWPRR
ncbi:MAG: XdhC family protein [Amphiplicatus sp.]